MPTGGAVLSPHADTYSGSEGQRYGLPSVDHVDPIQDDLQRYQVQVDHLQRVQADMGIRNASLLAELKEIAAAQALEKQGNADLTHALAAVHAELMQERAQDDARAAEAAEQRTALHAAELRVAELSEKLELEQSRRGAHTDLLAALEERRDQDQTIIRKLEHELTAERAESRSERSLGVSLREDLERRMGSNDFEVRELESEIRVLVDANRMLEEQRTADTQQILAIKASMRSAAYEAHIARAGFALSQVVSGTRQAVLNESSEEPCVHDILGGEQSVDNQGHPHVCSDISCAHRDDRLNVITADALPSTSRVILANAFGEDTDRASMTFSGNTVSLVGAFGGDASSGASDDPHLTTLDTAMMKALEPLSATLVETATTLPYV